MACNARDTPRGIIAIAIGDTIQTRLPLLPLSLSTAVTSMARSRLSHQPVYRRSVLRLTTMTG